MDSTVIAALIGVGGVTLTIGGTLGGAILGAHLNRMSAVRSARDLVDLERHKYTQDRLWDARKEAYTAVIAGLRATSRFADRIDERFNSGEMHPEEYHATEKYHRDVKELWDRWQVTQADFGNARLLLSDAFADQFEQIEKDVFEVPENIPPVEYTDYAAIFRAAFRRMLEIAKAEIAPPKPA